MNKSESISANVAIPRVNLAFAGAFARGDATAVAALYTSDAQILPPTTQAVQGHDAIQAFWEKVMAMGIKEAELRSVEIEGDNSLAWEAGQYALRGANAQILDQGKYIVIWHNQDGQWKLHRDIWNSSLTGD